MSLPLTPFGPSRVFPISVLDQATGRTTTLLVTKHVTSGGTAVLLDGRGQAYIASTGSILHHVRAEQFDRPVEEPVELKPGPRKDDVGDGYFPVLVGDEIVRVRVVGREDTGRLRMVDSDANEYVTSGKGAVRV